MSFLYSLAPHLEGLQDELIKCFFQTVQMCSVAGIVAFIFGLFFGVLLTVTKKDGIMECTPIYTIIDKAIDVIRSIPFIILIFILIPLSRAIVGTSIGVKGAYVALICGTVPFFARQIESAIAEVDKGLIEARQAMGFSPLEIIKDVYLKESIPSIARVSMITLVNLIGLTAMSGAVGAGGLGDFAIRYGYQLQYRDMIWVTVILILFLVSIVQIVGNIIIKKTTH